jgi:hypothetical protein
MKIFERRQYTQIAAEFAVGWPALSSPDLETSHRPPHRRIPAPFGMAHGRVEVRPKTTQLPVTTLLPPVPSASSQPRRLADRVALLDADGTHLSWLEDDDARRLVRQGKVEVLGTRNKVRAVRVVRGETLTADERMVAKRSGPARRHYSHNHETEDNPAGVWTLVRIPESQREFFGTPGCKAA